MKQLNFSKNSWHYRLNTFFNLECDMPNNICEYVRKTIVSVLLSIICLILAALLGFGVSTMFVPIIISLYIGYFPIGDDLLVLGSFMWVIAIILGLMLLYDHIKENRSFEPKHDSFIWSWYYSVKNKYCVKINFVD